MSAPSIHTVSSSTSPLSSIPQRTQDRSSVIDNLLNSGAFDDCNFSRTPRHGVKRFLENWEKERQNLETLASRVNYVDLKQSQCSGKLPLFDINSLPSFRYIQSPIDGRHHALQDKNGTVLAYRFPVPDAHIRQLQDSQTMLPLHPIQANAGGIFQHRHYALWADYSPTIMQSSEYRTDSPHSQSWLDTNKPLLTKLSNTLRMLDPRVYVKFTSIDKHLPPNLCRMAGAWHGVAVNERMRPQTRRPDTRIDWLNFPRGYNALVPWGTFTGGAVVLWQAKVIYQLQEGECLFFLGGVMAHQAQPIITGERNSLDLFTHKSSFDWTKRQSQLKANLYRGMGNRS